LAHPSQLGLPPNAGLSVGKQAKKGGRNVNVWVKAQFEQRLKEGGRVGEVEGMSRTKKKNHLRI